MASDLPWNSICSKNFNLQGLDFSTSIICLPLLNTPFSFVSWISSNCPNISRLVSNYVKIPSVSRKQVDVVSLVKIGSTLAVKVIPLSHKSLTNNLRSRPLQQTLSTLVNVNSSTSLMNSKHSST